MGTLNQVQLDWSINWCIDKHGSRDLKAKIWKRGTLFIQIIQIITSGWLVDITITTVKKKEFAIAVNVLDKINPTDWVNAYAY